MSGPWFRPKVTGLGYTPTNALGWLATLVFVSIAVATMTLLGDPAGAASSHGAVWIARLRADAGLGGVHLPLPIRFAILALEVAVFFAFARSRSSD
ncbi:MAG: hypothetical protein JSS35_17440 [Proteobacteria bacterium]|nr:hypothetical protein [Pseudomonadota bacterium]